MGNVKKHQHCKICQGVMDVIESGVDYVCRPYLVLGVCEKCIIKEGIKSIEEKEKDWKQEDINKKD